jgi:hypothetical protein
MIKKCGKLIHAKKIKKYPITPSELSNLILPGKRSITNTNKAPSV